MPTAPRMLLERQEEFREAVKKSKGRVVVLVHPYFLKSATEDYSIHQPERARQLFAIYQHTLKGLRKHANVPIVVFEEKPRVNETHQKLNGINTFFVPTIRYEPNPINAEWEDIHEEFRNAGVNTVLVGGMKAEQGIAQDPDIVEYEKALKDKPNNIIRGCAGYTYKQMIKANHGKVRWLPALTYPSQAYPCHPKKPKLLRWATRQAAKFRSLVTRKTK